ncbi:hypothetical protein ACUXZZ_02440 [Streptomyces graminifolii]|uniref:hypothetical protein n=1 Tax=Streptomyces graminifolii TaxID=1266771 RepID=UPI00405997E6
MDTQFITFDVVGAKKPEGGSPDGRFGAQGTIKPIESGYYRFTFRRTDGIWRIRHQDVIHESRASADTASDTASDTALDQLGPYRRR